LANVLKVKDKIEELDLLRALAAIAVIVIHVTASPLVLGVKGSLYHYVISLANQFARFSIPAFIFVTGLVLFHNYRDFKTTDWSAYFRKRVVFVLLPYFFWSAFYFFLKLHFSHQPLGLKTALQFVHLLLVGDAYYHLYFVVLIFQFYLLFPLLLPVWQRLGSRIGLITVLLFALYSGYIYLTFYNIKPWHSAFIQFLYQNQPKLFLTWAGFFILGAYCSFRLDSVRDFLSRRAGLLMIGSMALLAAMVYDLYSHIAGAKMDVGYAATSLRPVGLAFTVVTIFAVLAAAGKYTVGKQGLSGVVSSLANHSYGIYLIHPLVLTALEIVENKLALGYPLWLVAVNLVICVTASYGMTVMLSSNRWTKPIIGR